MPKKRGNNEGSVYERGDGLWVGAITLGYNSEGNPRRKVVYGKTRAEASKKLADLLDKFHKGILAEPSTVTVAQFGNDWLEREFAGKAENTKRNAKTELGYALEFMGKMRLQTVKPTHVRRLLDNLSEDGYSTSVLTKARGRLSAMFRDALRLEIVYRNPCEAIRVQVDRNAEEKGRTLEPHELALLLPALEAHTMGVYFRLLLDTGLRRGEGLALTWADMDLEAIPPKLSVKKNWTGDGYYSKPKTKRSYRKIPLAPSTMTMLRVLKEATVSKYGTAIKDMHLFGDAITGKPWHPNSPNTALKRICKKIQEDKEKREEETKIKEPDFLSFRLHDLRHTYGSVMIAGGVPVEVVRRTHGP